MAGTIETRLAELGITIPEASAPAANYMPWARSGDLLFTAGQLPLKDGKLMATGFWGTISTPRPARKWPNSVRSTS